MTGLTHVVLTYYDLSVIKDFDDICYKNEMSLNKLHSQMFTLALRLELVLAYQTAGD